MPILGSHSALFVLKRAVVRASKTVSQRCLSTTSGMLLTQGRGVFGALGQGTKLLDSEVYNSTVKFDTVSESRDGKANVSLVAAGWGHSAVIVGDGALYIFGRPYDFSTIMRIDKIYRFSKWIARYVSASSNSMFFGSATGYFPTPTRIETDEKVVDLSCSAGLTVFLTETGSVYSLGLNRWGQCGSSSEENAHMFQPTHVLDLPACRKIDAGLQHCIALTNEGDVYTWGKANKGQLGIIAEAKDLPPSALPTRVPLEQPYKDGKKGRNLAESGTDTVKAKSISAGFAHSAALSTDGSVYVWGKGMASEYKDKTFVAGSMKVCEDQLIPRKLALPGHRKAVEICSSNFNLVILAEDGSLWALGMGEHDRNANPEPLRVQTDFHPVVPAGADAHSASRRTRARAETGPTDGEPYLLVPMPGQDAQAGSTSSAVTAMRKGHQRVSIVIPEPFSELPQQPAPASASPAASTASAGSESAETGAGAVAASPSTANRRHFPDQGIFEVVVHGGEAYLIEMVLPMGEEDRRYKLVGHSGGWRHSLMIVQDA